VAVLRHPFGGAARVTIWDVAREAQVSKSTVSNVLRDLPVVTEPTRRAVLDAIDRLGYRPSAAARSLVHRRAQTIGVVVSDIRDPFNGEIARAIAVSAAAAGYSTILSDLGADQPGTAPFLDLVPEGRADALILAAWPTGTEVMDRLGAVSYPIAFVACRPWAGLEADYVNVDERLGVALAVQHLVALGHRAIGCIARAEDQAADRLAGFRQAIASAGIDLDDRLVILARPSGEDADFGTLAGYRAAETMLETGPRPTAIFAADDYLALGAMQAIEEAGFGVPADISLVGFDDIRFAELSRIALTTVHQPRALMGRQVTELVLGRLDRPDPHDRQAIVIEPQLTIRGSTGLLMTTKPGSI
jgi:LacI family transcriptional regulator